MLPSLQEQTVPAFLPCFLYFLCSLESGANSARTAECGLLQVCAKGPPRALLQPVLGPRAGCTVL